MSALRTGDTYLSFSSRDADLLSAGRTFVNMVILTLHNAVLYLRKAPANPGRPGKIFLILLIAPGNIPRKHTEITVPDQYSSGCLVNVFASNRIRQIAIRNFVSSSVP